MISDYRIWPVSWSGVWVGMLAALAAGLVIGLAGLALGAQQADDLEFGRMTFIGAFFAIIGSFFSFVIGGWVAARIAGIWRPETAALHGAIVWLLAVPLLVFFASLGAGSFFSVWINGLAGPIGGDVPDPRELRNSALGAATAMLLGLIGSVVGAWLGSVMNDTDRSSVN